MQYNNTSIARFFSQAMNLVISFYQNLFVDIVTEFYKSKEFGNLATLNQNLKGYNII